MELGAGLVHVADDVGHASLEAHEGGEVAGGGGVVAGELLALAAGALGALLGEEPKVTEARVLELAVRHLGGRRGGEEKGVSDGGDGGAQGLFPGCFPDADAPASARERGPWAARDGEAPRNASIARVSLRPHGGMAPGRVDEGWDAAVDVRRDATKP